MLLFKKKNQQIRNGAIPKEEKETGHTLFPGPCKNQKTGHYFSGVKDLFSVNQCVSAPPVLYSFQGLGGAVGEWGEALAKATGSWKIRVPKVKRYAAESYRILEA